MGPLHTWAILWLADHSRDDFQADRVASVAPVALRNLVDHRLNAVARLFRAQNFSNRRRDTSVDFVFMRDVHISLRDIDLNQKLAWRRNIFPVSAAADPPI